MPALKKLEEVLFLVGYDGLPETRESLEEHFKPATKTGMTSSWCATKRLNLTVDKQAHVTLQALICQWASIRGGSPKTPRA